MRYLLSGLLLTVVATVTLRNVAAQPPAGSQLDPDENRCATCHGDPDLWEKDTLRLYISEASLAEDIHFLNGVNCHDCHGGNPSSFDIREAHATDGSKDDSHVLPFRATLTLDHQVQACGACHEKGLQTYESSVHGRGLFRSGLSVTAVCADCHGAHGIYAASHEQSTLHASQVSATCSKCHRFIGERLEQSVHGRGNGPGGKMETAEPDGEGKRRPSCTDCHEEHSLAYPESASFRTGLPNRCAQCHADQSDRYAISMHGALTELGYGPAANCADCHGAHDILPISDPDSRVSAAGRQETCTKCHPRAPRNFLSFDPHADHRDPQRNLLLFCVYSVLITFLVSTFSFFVLHSIIWFVRGMVELVRHGRPKPLVPGMPAFVRFGQRHRVSHTFMVISFLGLAATGLPLKYSHYQWAQTLAYAFGGFESTSLWHRIFGLVNIGILVTYLFWMLRPLFADPRHGVSRIGLIFGPDSPVPNMRDLKDFLKMIRWFLGQGEKPVFERWAYWEKYDLWGASADIVVIGFTGLVLWFPYLFCAYLPGEVLNVAKVIHSTQALLATGFVFAIHFFNTHLRPEKFPMDMSILTGVISEEEAYEERPEFLERMRRAGKLEELKTTVPSRPRIVLLMLAGGLALVVGLGLLAGILLPIFAR